MALKNVFPIPLLQIDFLYILKRDGRSQNSRYREDMLEKTQNHNGNNIELEWFNG